MSVSRHSISGATATESASQQVSQTQAIDRRESPRVSYPYLQWLAPYVDGKMPPRSAFVEVRCRDISAGGFCYLSESAPEFKSVVIALGTGSGLTCLVAEIMQVAPIEYEGEQMFAIGCRYTGRLPR